MVKKEPNVVNFPLKWPIGFLKKWCYIWGPSLVSIIYQTGIDSGNSYISFGKFNFMSLKPFMASISVTMATSFIYTSTSTEEANDRKVILNTWLLGISFMEVVL